MATLPASVPVPESQASISPFGRLIGVLFSPKATFQDIVRKPSWILPVSLMLVFGIIAAVGINQKMNWREYIAQQIDKNPSAAQLSAEQKEQRIEAGAKIAPISAYVFGTLGPVVVVLVLALVMLGAYNVLGGANTDYKTSLGIVAHSYVPSFLSTILFMVILFIKPPGTLDLSNPIATNVAAFLPEDAPKWVDALCKNIDIFVLWVLILMAVGFAATNPKKLKGGASFRIAFGMFAAYVLLRVGIAFIFS
jgi:hypothetical protein